jgi:8-oxo-dGTP pyrophosphatase MutT (NUDIX family)
MTLGSHVVSVLLQRPDGRVLILQRAENRRDMPGLWCVISGYIEEGESALEAAEREVREEVGLEVKAEREGEPLRVPLSGRMLLIHPVLARVPANAQIKLDWENQDYRWIAPGEVYDFARVPQLEDDFIALGLLER